MLTLASGFLDTLPTAILALISIIVTGYAGLKRLPGLGDARFRLALAVALGIALHALLGLVIVAQPFDKGIAAIIGLTTINLSALAALYSDRSGAVADLTAVRAPLALWFGATVLGLLVASFPVSTPEVLYDGPYVLKKTTAYVNIQVLVGNYPMDNIVPAIAGEYLLRGIPFEKERPLMPGQEVTNRPLLVALLSVPFRALLGPVGDYQAPLPRFEYGGTNWPDFSSLLTDHTFRQYLGIGTLLNASLIIAFHTMLVVFGVRRATLLTIGLAILSPYVLLHTIFTWPKNLAAFFILTGGLLLSERRHSAASGTLLGLAYWAHPYALVFAASFALHQAVQWMQGRITYRAVATYAATALAPILVWLIWGRFVVNIPSDLVSQNLVVDGSILNLVWVRFWNLYTLLFPSPFGTFPFSLPAFTAGMLVTYAGAVGMLLTIPTVVATYQEWKSRRAYVTFMVVVPGLLLIVVFSTPNPPMMHGWQAIAPLTLALGIRFMQDCMGRIGFAALVILQAILHVGFLGLVGHQVAANGVTHLVYWPATEVRHADAPPNMVAPVTMDDVTRYSLFSSSPAQVIYRGISIPESSMLALSLGLHPAIYGETAGDGADFLIDVVGSGERRTILKFHDNPIRGDTPKGWKDFQLSLGEFTGQIVDIVLTCNPGLNENRHADWCIWGDPKILPAPLP